MIEETTNRSDNKRDDKYLALPVPELNEQESGLRGSDEEDDVHVGLRVPHHRVANCFEQRARQGRG